MVHLHSGAIGLCIDVSLEIRPANYFSLFKSLKYVKMSVVKYFKYCVNCNFCIYMALVLLYSSTCVLSGIDLHLMDFTLYPAVLKDLWALFFFLN